MKKTRPRPPQSPCHQKDRSGRRDIDMRLSCRSCGQKGLRYGTKTHLCELCCRARPALMKAAGTADARKVLQRLTRSIVDRYGFERAPGMLGLPPSSIDAALDGTVWIGPEGARASPPPAESDRGASPTPTSVPDLGAEIDPEIAWLMMRQHRQFAPLDGATTELVRPWRPVLRQFVAREQPHHRTRRQSDARHRATLIRYVPRADAPLDPQTAGNAFGRISDRQGTRRAPFPFRIALALWAFGLGAGRISRLATTGGCPIGTSTVSRVLIQARRRFEGSEKVRCEDLAAELLSRPLQRMA